MKIFFIFSGILFAGNLIFGVCIFWIQGKFLASIGSNSREEKLFRISDKIVLGVSALAFIAIFLGLVLLFSGEIKIFLQDAPAYQAGKIDLICNNR